MDILLTPGGDLDITGRGDVALTESIRQAVRIRLLWHKGEWRFAPGLGVPWFEDVFTKSPNTARIRAHIRREALAAKGVRDVRDVKVETNPQTRRAKISFELATDEGTFREEAEIPWQTGTA